MIVSVYKKKTIWVAITFLLMISTCTQSVSLPAFISRFVSPREHDSLTKECPLEPQSTIDITAITGTILIKSWNQPKALIEATKTGTTQALSNTTIYTKQQGKLLSISTRTKEPNNIASIDYQLLVPENTHIKIRSSGTTGVKIRHISGTITISLAAGPIDIQDSSQAVLAKTNNGPIKLKQKAFDDQNSIFLETAQGPITLAIGRQTHAQLTARTQRGTITCNKHVVTLDSRTMPLNYQAWQAFQRDIQGKLGQGGAPITLETAKGTIFIDDY
jgi:DUF4097 and DUF4098 domain-containing protein YvlB